MPTEKKPTAEDLCKCIRTRFAGRDFAVLEQVPNGTGLACSSWIDAAVISLWPSKGLWRAALEVKVSRSDFLRELQNPIKNQWAREYFNEFWFVAPADVIKEEELPEGTGWMKPRGGSLVTVRAASRKAAKSDDEFVAALARAIDKERERFIRDATKDVLENSVVHQEALRFQSACEEFVNRTGGHVYGYDREKILEALTEATQSKEITHTVARAYEILNHFRDQMLQALSPFAKLCNDTIQQADSAGKKLFDLYGLPDENSIDAMRQRVKSRKHRHGYRDEGAAVSMIDAISEVK